MNLHNKSQHQQEQIKVIDEIEKQVNNEKLSFSLVDPTENYENDKRFCLTSVHLLKKELMDIIHGQLINPLKSISPEHYYYGAESLHMTIKNIRVINDPPRFDKNVINKAKNVFSKVIPNHKKFQVFFYRLLLFPYNLALIGTTEPELDRIALDLDRRLKESDIPDDKLYINKQYFFSNITLARFTKLPSKELIRKVDKLSSEINIRSYVVDSVTLLTSNAVLKKRTIIGSWRLI